MLQFRFAWKLPSAITGGVGGWKASVSYIASLALQTAKQLLCHLRITLVYSNLRWSGRI